jgi:hypothetical protein
MKHKIVLFQKIELYTSGNGQKPSRTKALPSKNDKADKSPPVKMSFFDGRAFVREGFCPTLIYLRSH